GVQTCALPICHPVTNEIVGILDVTGDYHLIRPFLTSFLAAAALETRQHLHLLLSAQKQHEWPYSYRYSHGVKLLGNSHAYQANEITMSQSHPPKLHSDSSSISLNDMQWQLSRQERRAHDAECLAAATG